VRIAPEAGAQSAGVAFPIETHPQDFPALAIDAARSPTLGGWRVAAPAIGRASPPSTITGKAALRPVALQAELVLQVVVRLSKSHLIL
jgi:hypothetical protein